MGFRLRHHEIPENFQALLAHDVYNAEMYCVGVIHSDLKPANFMMVAGNLRLIDFGIANAVQQDKTSIFLNTPMGTLNYMSPEAIMESFEGSDGGSASDRVKPTYKVRRIGRYLPVYLGKKLISSLTEAVSFVSPLL